MNDLQIFNNPEFGKIRGLEIDGEPWAVGKDVAAALGYDNPTKAVRDHVDSEDKMGAQNGPPLTDSMGPGPISDVDQRERHIQPDFLQQAPIRQTLQAVGHVGGAARPP